MPSIDDQSPDSEEGEIEITRMDIADIPKTRGTQPTVMAQPTVLAQLTELHSSPCKRMNPTVSNGTDEECDQTSIDENEPGFTPYPVRMLESLTTPGWEFTNRQSKLPGEQLTLRSKRKGNTPPSDGEPNIGLPRATKVVDSANDFISHNFQAKRLARVPTLCITDERNPADIAGWFDEFMRELCDQSIPQSRWLDYLKMNMEDDTRQLIFEYLTHIKEKGYNLTLGKELFLLLVDEILMEKFVSHHPAVLLCRWFSDKDYWKQTAHQSYKRMIIFKQRYNEAADRCQRYGQPTQYFTEHTFALIYLTALRKKTVQKLRSKLKTILRRKHPLRELSREAIEVEDETLYMDPFRDIAHRSGTCTVGLIHRPENQREKPFGRREDVRPWSERKHELCFFCGMNGHLEETCNKWNKVKHTYPHNTCCICLRQGHKGTECNETLGKMWSPLKRDRYDPRNLNQTVAVVQEFKDPVYQNGKSYGTRYQPKGRYISRAADKRKPWSGQSKYKHFQRNTRQIAYHNPYPIYHPDIQRPTSENRSQVRQIQQPGPEYTDACMGPVPQEISRISPGESPKVVANIRDLTYPREGRQVVDMEALNIQSISLNRSLRPENQITLCEKRQNVRNYNNVDFGDEEAEEYNELIGMVTDENPSTEMSLKIDDEKMQIMEVPLRFENETYTAVCDTGCPYTLISEKIAMIWEENGTLKPIKSHIRRLADVNGRELKFNRSVEMAMETRSKHKGFENTQTKFSIGIVEWLPVDLLLGVDAMRLMQITIDMSQRHSSRMIFAYDLRGKKAPVDDLHLYRVLFKADTQPLKVGVKSICNDDRFTYYDKPEDLTTTCMTVGAWVQTAGRHLKDKDQVYPQASKEDLKERQGKSLRDTSIVSYDFLKKAIFHDKPTSWSNEQRGTFFQLCLNYPTIWNSGDLPLSSTSLAVCNLELEGNPKPVKIAVRPMSECKKAITREKIQEMLKEGIITVSESTWAAPVVLVPKVNDEWRLCIDYRELNKALKVTSWPLPRMHQVSDRMRGIRFVCALDLLQGYYQIELTQESRHLTAFQTTEGLYQYTRLPFGLAVAPAIFQHFVDDLLGSLRPYKVEAYLDDFLLKGETWSAFLQNAQDLFEKCKKHHVQFKPQKCDMGLKELAFLGYLISMEGIRPIPLKTLPVQMFKIPSTRKQLKSFLGMAGYYRKFVKDYASKAAILHGLDRNDITFTWTPAHQEAFDLLKNEICEATLLAHPDYSKTFIIDCDASNIGLGAVLSQPGEEKKEKPISFASRKLTGAEIKWGATELEAFAVVWALEIFRPWIDGCQVEVRTDHSPLLWLQKNVNKTPKLARWVLRLQEFNFNLQHRPGKAQVVADALSRHPLDRQPNDNFDFDAVEKGKNMFTDVVVGECVLKIGKDTNGADVNENERVLWQDPALIPSKESRKIEPFTKERLLEEIELCPICMWALQKINNESLQNPRWLNKINGRLERDSEGRIWVVTAVRRATNSARGTIDQTGRIRRILIPSGMIQGILQRIHGGSHGGHFAYDKTLLKIREKFYWPTLKTDVRRFIMGCALCWSVGRNPEGRLRPKAILPTGSPGEVIAMDFFGPLPKTQRKNRFILVIIDHFTRWVLVEPLINAKAYSVVQTIIDRWIPTHGLPRIILSDNGPHFRSKITTKLCEKLGIRNIFSTPYHPQGNGVVEAFMRPLKKILSIQVSEMGNHWDLCCSAASYAYNSTPHVLTQRSPFFLMHGFEALLPVQRELELPMEPRISDLWIKGLWEARRMVFMNHIEEHRRRQVALKGTGFPLNSFVALKHSSNDRNDEYGKLGSLMSGPWKVVKKTSNGVTHFVECPASGEIRQVTTGQMRLVELPLIRGNTDEMAQSIINHTLPLAEIDSIVPPTGEPEEVPKDTEIGGRVLRNTNARRANAAVTRQMAKERTVLI